MKTYKRLFALLLAFLLVFSMTACGEKPVEQETTEATTEATEPTEKELTEEEKILAERRDIVEQYMRKSVTLLWRSTEDTTYVVDRKTFYIEAGKLYRGVPYTYSGSTMDAFLEFAGEPDEKGIYTVSGLTDEIMNSGTGLARIGNCCSTTLQMAWSQVGDTTVCGSGPQNMYQKNGFLPVGDYVLEVEEGSVYNTGEVIMKNGRDTIYKAYAQLQKGDAVVETVKGPGHVMMSVSVDVVYNDDGTIDPVKSVVTFLHQTRNYHLGGGAPYFDETIGEEVHKIGGVDDKFTFKMLAQQGYIPITCKELIDASYTPAEPAITDTEIQWSKDNILTGTFTCTRDMDKMTLTITDKTGTIIQQAEVLHSVRNKRRVFDLQQFTTESPAARLGSLDIEALTSGDYHCTVVCRLTTGEEITARDFDFTV